MDAKWTASIIANGCFARVPCGVVAPVKGDILIRRRHGERYDAVLVAGVYPHISQIGLRHLLRPDNGVSHWGDVFRSDNAAIVNGQWRHQYNKKMVPKALPNAPVPVAQRIREVPPHIITLVKDQYETLNLFYGQKYECPICVDEIFGSNLHITKCGHFFCKECIGHLPPEWERTDGCPQCRAKA